MQISQETLPVTKGWVQVKNLEEFLRLYKEGRKVYFQCRTPFDRHSQEQDLIEVCGSNEGIFIENLSCEKGRGFLDEFLQGVYPQIREALNIKSNVIENIAAALKTTRP
jgi:hypothetical protein